MTRRTLSLLALALLPATLVLADFSGHLADLESGMKSRRDELAANPDNKKAVKSLDKGLKILAKPKTSAGYAKEVKAASKVAKILEKKLSGETELLDRLENAVDAYGKDLRGARDALAAAASGKKDEKNLKKADKALAKADLAVTAAKELSSLAKAAKVLEEWIGVGDGGSGEEATWVVTTFTVAGAGEGTDLDGDGRPDNALGDLQALIRGAFDLQKAIDDQRAAAGSDVLIQFWDVGDWNGDPRVSSGVMNGVKSPSGAYDVSLSVGADGRPLLNRVIALGRGGSFMAAFGGDPLEVGGFELPAAAKVVIEGKAQPASNQGFIGVAIPVDIVIQFLEDQGVDVSGLTLIGLNLLLDLDLDGDGENDALSAAFAYDSVPAKIVTR